MSRRRPLTLLFAVSAGALMLSACGASSESADVTTIAVDATDTACTLDTSAIAAGTTRFIVTNNGNDTTEVYVYAERDGVFSTVVSEVENIGPGATRDMQVDLVSGDYEIACKPGQTGDGIRAGLEVRGASSAAAVVASREVVLDIDTADALAGVERIAPESGERLEFKVTNGASAMRVFEVKRPDGSVAGETEIAAGATGELYIDLTVDGDWLLIVEGGPVETEATLSVG